MWKGPRRRLAYGYDVGLNSAVTHRIASDKAATAELLGTMIAANEIEQEQVASVLFTTTMDTQLSQRVALEADLRHALERDQLRA